MTTSPWALASARKYSELMLNLVTPLQEVSKDTTALLLYLNCVPYSFLSCFSRSLSLSPKMCEEVSELGSNISATNDIDHMCTAFGTNLQLCGTCSNYADTCSNYTDNRILPYITVH